MQSDTHAVTQADGFAGLDDGDVSDHILRQLNKPAQILQFPATSQPSRLAQIRDEREEQAFKDGKIGLRERILSVAWNVYPNALDVVQVFKSLGLGIDYMREFARVGQELEDDGLMAYVSNGAGCFFTITRKGREHLLSLVLFAGTTVLDLEELIDGSPAMREFMNGLDSLS